MIQKSSSDFSDQDLRTLLRDSDRWELLRKHHLTLWEELERRALKLGLIVALRQGEPEPVERGVSWQDPEFQGF